MQIFHASVLLKLHPVECDRAFSNMFLMGHLYDKQQLLYLSVRDRGGVEMSDVRQAFQANKDRWCMKQKVKRGGSSLHGGKREGNGMKEDISNLPSWRMCRLLRALSLFLCPSISISYLIDKACGVLKAGPGREARPLSLRGARSH